VKISFGTGIQAFSSPNETE